MDAKANSQLRLLWISYGAEDRAVTVHNRQFKEYLKSKDIHVKELERPGSDHTWTAWRQDLTGLAQLLFQPKGK